jgi:putative copper export protein
MIEKAILQTMQLCAYCVVAGGFFFEHVVLRGERLRSVREHASTARLRAISWALIAAFLTTALTFIAERGGANATIGVWVRVGLLLALLGLLRQRRIGWATTLLTLLLLGGQSAASRSAAFGVPALAGDWFHLACAAFWLGGVVILTVTAGSVARDGDAAVVRAFGAAVERFSPFALFCVGALALGGIAQSSQFLSGVDALWATEYGRALLVKVAVFGVLIGFGAWHRQALAPRLRRWALRKGDAAEGVGVVRRFQRSLRAEAAFGTLLLAAVGVMKAITL